MVNKYLMIHGSWGARQLSGSYTFTLKQEKDNDSNWLTISQHEAERNNVLMAATSFHSTEQSVPLIVKVIRARANWCMLGVRQRIVENFSSLCLCSNLFYLYVATVVPLKPKREQGMLLQWFHPMQSTVVSMVLGSLDCSTVLWRYMTAHIFACSYIDMHWLVYDLMQQHVDNLKWPFFM